MSKKKSVKRKAGRAAATRAKGTRRSKPVKATKRIDPLVPVPIKTGKGPGPAEVGAKLVEMFNRGELGAIEKMFWSPGVVSIEGVGVALAWKGRKAVEAKNREWASQNRIISATAEGPYVGATGFAVKFMVEVEEIASGARRPMQEVGVYSVLNGKIVQEEFMYYCGG